MKTKFLPALLVFFLAPLNMAAQPVTEYPGENSSLEKRMAWAPPAAKGQDGYWIGYSISKFMQEGSWMGSIGGDDWATRKSLYAWLGKAHLEEELPEELRRNLSFVSNGIFYTGRRTPEAPLYLKEVGVLIYFESQQAGATEINLTNMSLGVDLDSKPLYWLGKSADEESVAWLRALFDSSKDEDLRSDILGAIVIHENRADNFDFFARVLNEDQSIEIRKKAIFWLGESGDPRAVDVLIELVQNSR